MFQCQGAGARRVSTYSIFGGLSYRCCSLMISPYGNIIPPSFMRFVTGGHVWKFLLERFCMKLGCVWPKENSQSPNITHISLEKSKHIFSPGRRVSRFHNNSCVTIKHSRPRRDSIKTKGRVCVCVGRSEHFVPEYKTAASFLKIS